MSPRLPSRHDMPLEPLEMTEADAVAFAQQIATGYNGRAPWRRACACDHPARMHNPRGGCTVCACQVFRRASHEVLLIELHPEAVNYLPPDVTVLNVGNRYRDGMVVFHLARGLDASRLQVIRSGVRQETTIYTSPPDDMEV